ncbi:MAG: ATP-binding protein [Myxococcaceae bacterium]|nr:ATP-binding protein [Myxococcaceae bacterium]
MKTLVRDLEPRLVRAAKGFGAIVLTGPRRAGKTFCLRHAFPSASYQLLEDPETIARVRSDPRAWLDELKLPVIIDEVQHAPELLQWIRARIDRAPAKNGQWFITGSQDFALMKGVTESMAGRAAIFQMLPLSAHELDRWDLLRGGYPEVWQRPKLAADWFRSYVQSYLERDVRDVTHVKDLGVFRRFLSLAAMRSGHLLNKSELAQPLGVSVPTIGQWVDVLQTTGVVQLVHPYFENFEKRLLKTPKLYFNDAGLLCHLLGFDSLKALEKTTLIGQVFETFVASELVKQQLSNGLERAIYYFRDEQGLEVDFVVPRDSGQVELIEAKWTKTPTPPMAKPIGVLLEKLKGRGFGTVICRGARDRPERATLAPDVKAVSVEAAFQNVG